MSEEIKKLKALLKRAKEHLEYCNYGDSWERECSVDLQKDLDTYFKGEQECQEEKKF